MVSGNVVNLEAITIISAEKRENMMKKM